MSRSRAPAWTPAIDVYETADRYVVTAEVPVSRASRSSSRVEENRLTIRGSRPVAVPRGRSRRYHQVERGHGAFARTFEFTDAISSDRIKADLHDGILTVTLPKTAGAGATHRRAITLIAQSALCGGSFFR